MCASKEQPRTAKAGPLDRLLRVVSEVHAGEAVTALLMLVSLFGLLVAYYILKTLREPLILAGGGAELKSYAAAFQAVLAAAKASLPAGLSGPAATEHTKRFIGSFYADFFFWVNIASLLIQGLLVSRIVKYTKMAGVLLLLPIVALGAYGLIALGAGFVVLRWVKTAENATDYSVMNTAKAMLWLPTNRDESTKPSRPWTPSSCASAICSTRGWSSAVRSGWA